MRTRAINCGDDTDCTAATVGSILGIINGKSNIPSDWQEYIGENTEAQNRIIVEILCPGRASQGLFDLLF